jgi:glucose-6-phosphate isomerase
VVLTLHRDKLSSSGSHAQRFIKEEVLAKLRALDTRARRKGLDSLDPAKNRLIHLGMEVDAAGRVTKNSYGVFHLAWRAAEDGDWAGRVNSELDEIRGRILAAHGCRLKYLVWAGMGGSAEDKSLYNAAGLLKRGPRLYVLDSTDPSKLKHILADIEKRSGSLAVGLKSTLVVGMALGMTSYEPVVNLEKLSALYEKHGIDSTSNFIYMTLPGSLLDQFASARGYRRVEMQLDGGNSTAGRHSAPLTRGSLYPLGLAGVDLDDWIEGAQLDDATIGTAWDLSAWLQGHAEAGRDKVTLLLPDSWKAAGIWTKQDFEESLGESESIGIKVVVDEPVKLANYYAPRDGDQDRVFLVVSRVGESRGPGAAKLASLKRAGYPVAEVKVPRGVPLSGYMQFIHYVVFGLGYLRDMNFVTQPSVELYKAITGRIHQQAAEAGDIRESEPWKRLVDPATTLRYRAGVALHVPFVANGADVGGDAAALYARLLRERVDADSIDTAELTYFGDTRYSPKGKAVRKVLDRAAETVFRSVLRLPVDVYEGPAMNHSYHEMIIGHGRCFTTVFLCDKQESIPAAGYTAGYHTAQFLATQMALSERGRPVAAIILKSLEESTLSSLGEFFQQARRHLR